MPNISRRTWGWLSVALLALIPTAAVAQRSTPVQALHPSGAALDQFGYSVAVDGDTMIVGASRDDVGANTDQGSAHVYRWTGSGWTFEATLTATGGAANDQFGSAVAISGDTAIVGAYFDDVGANIDQGAAYVFVRSGTTWTQQAQLTAAGGVLNDFFGIAVALSGNTAIVGAYFDDVGANINQGSAYVFARSGSTWTQQAQLTAASGTNSDQFGVSVTLSGDTAIVGAYLDDVGANSNQGSAYVFTRSGTIWTQQAQLNASGGGADDRFGYSVALSGDTVVVGAYLDDVGANTDQGSAYVFTRTGTTWTQQAQLTATGGAAVDWFGYSVALSGETVIVGAYNDDVGANTDQGSAYVFTRSGTTWTQQAQLNDTAGAALDNFGTSVAISGDTAIVGANVDDVGANSNQGSAWVFSRVGSTWIGPDFQAIASDGTDLDQFGYSVGISGNTAIVGTPFDDVGANGNQGSAYIFVRSGSAWTQQAQLTATGGASADVFGWSVAISGDTALIGSYADDVGPNANQGSAYVFVRSGSTWTQQAQLVASSGAASDQFGYSVALDGDTALIGSNADTVGANANQGSAYVFTRSGTSWTQQAQLTVPDGAAGDQFGISVAISGDTAIIGAHLDDVGANSNQGSVYVYTRTGSTWLQQAQLLASDGAAADTLGSDVALDGDTAVVGATANVGANFDQGAVYVFVRAGTIWTQQAKLVASDGAASDNFGYAVDLDNDTIIVGTPLDDIGANNNQGSIYLFVRSGSVWTQQARLLAPDGLNGDNFGFSVAVSGSTVLAGASADDVSPAGNRGSAWFFDVPSDDFALAENNVTGAVSPTMSAALLPALSGQQITATEAAWRGVGSLNTLSRSLALLSSGDVRTPSTATLELGGSSFVAASPGSAMAIFGQLRVASSASADLFADAFTLGSRGIMTARTGSSLNINAPNANLQGQTRVEQNASLTFSGNATAIGPTTANLNSSLTAGGTFTNIDTFTITTGTLSMPLFLNQAAANIFGTSALFGSYTNDAGAITTIRSGTLFIFGSLTNNGTINGTVCAGCSGSPPTLDLTGSLVLGPDANLTMPFQDALVRLGGNFDAAINDHIRYDMAQATLQFEGTGATQTLEAMSLDRGPDALGLDRTIAGNFPIGTLRIGQTASTVQTVDVRDNDLLGQTACEAIYVDTLIIDTGSTLDTSACVTIYYNTLINNGTVTDPAKLVPLTPPCPADFDGSGFVDSDDFVLYIDQFNLGCVGPGQDIFGANPNCLTSADFDQSGFIDSDDFVAFIAAFSAGC
jgi:hypothetical protein